MMNLTVDLQIDPVSSEGTSASVEVGVALDTWSGDSRFSAFRREIRNAFEAEAVEDGFSHAAETVLERALREHGSAAQRWLQALLERTESASFIASILKCLGRIDRPGSESWRAGILREALSHPHAEVRDAAVQAIEAWGDTEAIEILRRHDDSQGWLRDYITRVVRDLSV